MIINKGAWAIYMAGHPKSLGPNLCHFFFGPILKMPRFVIPETNFRNSKFILSLPKRLNIIDFIPNIVTSTRVKYFLITH